MRCIRIFYIYEWQIDLWYFNIIPIGNFHRQLLSSRVLFTIYINPEKDTMSSYQSFRQKIVAAYYTDPSMATNILTEVKGNRFYITFNRPKRYNAFSYDMFYTFTHSIIAANQNPDVKFIIISGAAGNFTSGNDLSNFTNSTFTSMGSTEQMAQQNANILEQLCNTIIKSEKPIFAIAEGKVIGFGFTQMALYDRVFAVQTSEFNAPLVQLAQGPEMCASFTFPKIFGRRIAEDLVIKGEKVKPAFLQKFDFVTSVKTRKDAEQALDRHLQDLELLEWTSYVKAREIFRERENKILLQVNHRECSNLVQRWINPNLPAHLMEYMARTKKKSKL